MFVVREVLRIDTSKCNLSGHSRKKSFFNCFLARIFMDFLCEKFLEILRANILLSGNIRKKCFVNSFHGNVFLCLLCEKH